MEGRRSVQTTNARKYMAEPEKTKKKKRPMSSHEIQASVERLHKSGQKSAEKSCKSRLTPQPQSVEKIGEHLKAEKPSKTRNQSNTTREAR